jgi:hypothetical protein
MSMLKKKPTTKARKIEEAPNSILIAADNLTENLNWNFFSISAKTGLAVYTDINGMRGIADLRKPLLLS